MIWSNPLDNAIEIALSKLFDGMSNTFKTLTISFSSFGDKGIFYILVGILLLFFIKSRKVGFTLLLGVFFTLIINDLILKNIFDRTRPFNDPILVEQLVSVVNNGGKVYGITPTSSSFPSGHTFTAFYCFGGILSLFLFDKENKKVYLAPLIFFGIFAFLMGFSRVLLSHHYFTDVLCGGILGIIIGLSTYIILKYLYKLVDIIKIKIKEK